MGAILGDISIVRGDSYPFNLRIKDKASDSYIDITDYTFIMTVDSRSSPDDDTTKLFEVVGAVDSDQVTNTGLVSFTPTITDTDLDPGKYYYDIQMTYSSGNTTYKRTIAKHDFAITQDITKS